MKKESFERAKWIPIFIVAVILMLIYKTIDNITQITSAIGNFLAVISPLLYGILFAYFLYLPHNAIEKLLSKIKIAFISKHARGFSTILIFMLLILLLIFLLSFLLPIIFSNLVALANSIPEYIATILAFLNNIPEDSILASFDIAGTIRSYSGDIINAIVNPAGIEQLARGVMSFAGGIFSIAMGLVISLYILLDRNRIAGFFRSLGSAVFKHPERERRTVKYLSQVNKVLFTFIASKGLDSIINIVVATTILLIFGVPYAPLLGLVAGVFNFIPYLGSIISTFVISAITLITGDVSTMLKVMICLLAFNQIDGNFIEPRIMKSSLKINPILVIIAVVIGGAYMGIVGMFLAVPAAAIIKQLLLEYIASTDSARKKNREGISNASADASLVANGAEESATASVFDVAERSGVAGNSADTSTISVTPKAVTEKSKQESGSENEG